MSNLAAKRSEICASQLTLHVFSWLNAEIWKANLSCLSLFFKKKNISCTDYLVNSLVWTLLLVLLWDSNYVHLLLSKAVHVVLDSSETGLCLSAEIEVMTLKMCLKRRTLESCCSVCNAEKCRCQKHVPLITLGFSKWLHFIENCNGSGNTQFKFHSKLIVRKALYHCCPVSRSNRPVVIYLLPCDSLHVTICL